MFNQYFGNYLFSNNYITKEQLLSALSRQPKTHLSLGMVALYLGTMSAPEVAHVMELKKEEQQQFGELAIKHGYLTHPQVVELIETKVPDFLVLGQILIEDEVFTYTSFANILADYRSQTEFLDLELNDENRNDFHRLVEDFSIVSETSIPDFGKSYLELLYNNFVRYIGDDFSSLPPSIFTEFPTDNCVSQTIEGNFVVNTYFNMDDATALAFAERYSGETYKAVDEYVVAAIEDVLNLHNGLFIVNASNDRLSEFSIGVINHHPNTILSFENTTFVFPISYSFGIIYFIMEIVSI